MFADDLFLSTRRPRLGRPKPLQGKSFDDTVRFERMGSTTPEPSQVTSEEEEVTEVTETTSEEALEELWARVTELGPSGRRALRRLAVRLDSSAPGSSEETTEVLLLRRLVQQLLNTKHNTKVHTTRYQRPQIFVSLIKSMHYSINFTAVTSPVLIIVEIKY